MNPLGETCPAEPVPNGCGDVLCVERAWFAFELPPDDGVAEPCARCAAAITAALHAEQEDWLRVLRSADAALGGGPL